MGLLDKIEKPIIYPITKGNLTDSNFQKESIETYKLIEKASQAGFAFIQIREKIISTKLLFELTLESVKITQKTRTKIIVNERIDVAISANADGVHLTSNAIPTQKVRSFAPKNFIIGVSTHSAKEAILAKKQGADFVTYSPIFKPISKPIYGKPKGVAKLKEVCDYLRPFTVLALGGIDNNNFRKTLDNGAKGFAGISFFTDEFIDNFGPLN